MIEPRNEATSRNAPPPVRELRAEAWLPVLQDALAQQGRFIVSLRGNSMQPTLPEGCEIEIVPLKGAPQLGQLIVFAAGDTLVAHRLVGLRNGLWIAQGDNRRGPDLPLRPEIVLGVVATARVEGHRVWPRQGERICASFWVTRYHVLETGRWALRKLVP